MTANIKSYQKGSHNWIFGLPIDLAHRLYNSLLLSHKPWLSQQNTIMHHRYWIQT